VTVDPEIVRLAQDRNFAVFTVLLTSGQPMSHVMWVDADDEHVLINTECTARSSARSSAIRG